MNKLATIPILRPFMPNGILPKIQKTLYSGWIGEGPTVQLFEKKIGQYIGNQKVSCVNSGTSALHLAVRLAGVKPGDEVISTAFTCSATNLPIMHAGAKIVWADIEPDGINIAPEEITKKITKKTKAIMVVDLVGMPARIREINKIAKENNLAVIEDAAQAFGAEYENKKIGNHSDFVCFSFQAVKTITSVDGGALLTKSKSASKKAKLLRWFGIDREKKWKQKYTWEYQTIEGGFKYHMNDVTATLGIEQLRRVSIPLAKQRNNAAYYMDELSSIPQIRLLENTKNSNPSWWLFPIWVPKPKKLIDYLATKKIQASPQHIENHKLAVFKPFFAKLPNFEKSYSQFVCIPNGYWVSENDRERVVTEIKKYFRRHG